MARVIWKEGNLVSLKLRENLFTIGQFLVSPSMRFYDVFNTDGAWINIDLNLKSPLFQAFISQAVIQNLVQERIKEKTVISSNLPFESLLIDANLNFDGGFAFKGGKLIDIGTDGKTGTTVAPVVKQNLSISEDRECIEKYELTNMWGPGPLSDRLCRYFDTGINRDDLKFEIFPGLWNDREQLRPLTRRLPEPLR